MWKDRVVVESANPMFGSDSNSTTDCVTQANDLISFCHGFLIYKTFIIKYILQGMF